MPRSSTQIISAGHVCPAEQSSTHTGSASNSALEQRAGALPSAGAGQQSQSEKQPRVHTPYASSSCRHWPSPHGPGHTSYPTSCGGIGGQASPCVVEPVVLAESTASIAVVELDDVALADGGAAGPLHASVPISTSPSHRVRTAAHTPVIVTGTSSTLLS